MRSRFMIRSAAVATLAVLLSLTGCQSVKGVPAADTSPSTPSASATPRGSTTPSTSSVSPSASAVSQRASDPFEAKRVDLSVGYSVVQKTTMPCNRSDASIWTARAGSYAAFVNQYAAGVLDISTGQWLWCEPTGFGGTDGVAKVTTDSSVGRPGYTPILDADTLEAAEFDSSGEAFFMQAGDETLLVVPVTIDRPQIGSQKEAKLRGLVAFDGQGTKKWIAGLPSTSGAGSPTCSSDATRCIVQQGGGSSALVTSVDAETGELSTLAQQTNGLVDSSSRFVGSDLFLVSGRRSEAMWVDYGSDPAPDPLITDDGTPIKSDWYLSINKHLVIAADQAHSKASKIWVFDTANGSSSMVPFEYSKRDCLRVQGQLMLCMEHGSSGSIGAFNLATGEVVWEWRENDPDPDTQVPRKVPEKLYVYDDLVVADYTNAEKRYCIDPKSGLDTPFDRKQAAAFDSLRSNDYTPYGYVSTSGSTISYAHAK